MPIHLILNTEQADKVRGITTPGHGLDPLMLSEGRYILPVAVLSDPNHAVHHALLQPLPQEDISHAEIMAVLDPPEPVVPEPPPPPVRGGASPREKNDALTGPKLKLEWAKRHVEDLKSAIRAFHESNPYELVHEVDPQSGENVYRIRVHECVPVELSATLGDAVHNLRASLDQLLCTLVRQNNNVPTASHGFPIANRRHGHEAFVDKKVSGITEKAKRLILRLKPYEGGNPHLWRIHALDILDKHDGIVPVGAAHALTQIRFTMPGLFVGPDQSLRLLGGGSPLRTEWGIPDGAALVSPLTDNVEVYRSPAGLNEEIQVAIQIAFDQPAIVQGEPVVETLEEFARFVEKLLGVFERQVI